ncbi:hypothetical protein KAR91_25960 [Candidatus Pacearchaeota archaeon]|nr:hypothetical protein [Candidatus Pacearchaeota archaeon]
MGESKHIMTGSEFAVLKEITYTLDPGREYGRIIDSDCEKFKIVVQAGSQEKSLEAAKHVALALNSHDDLLEACEIAEEHLLGVRARMVEGGGALTLIEERIGRLRLAIKKAGGK